MVATEQKLKAELAIYTELKRRLEAQNDADLTDTLEGETNLHELVAATLREATATKAMVDGLKGHIEVMQSRRVRLESKIASLRNVALWALQEAGLTKLTAPDLTVTVSKGNQSIAIDEAMLDVRFMKQITKILPDKEAIQGEIDAGRVPYGVRIGNAEPFLTIRVK